MYKMSQYGRNGDGLWIAATPEVAIMTTLLRQECDAKKKYIKIKLRKMLLTLYVT